MSERPHEHFALLLRVQGGSVPAVVRLRQVLKSLLRTHGIKCEAGAAVADAEAGRAALRAAAAAVGPATGIPPDAPEAAA